MGSLTIKLISLARLFALGSICTVAVMAVADDTDRAPMPKRLVSEDGTDPAPVVTRRHAIEQELAKRLAGHAWAGSYYEGDGTGANISLQIAPDAGVAATWNGCMGLYGANEGAVSEQSDGSLHLAFNWANRENEFGNFPTELVPVSWGERNYLIPPDRLLAFVNDIHRGLEPRTSSHGSYYLRVGDEEKAVGGLPSLPSDHLALIRSESKTFSVVNVERLPDRPNEIYCDTAWRLTIVTDGDDRLRLGTELVVSEPATSGDYATIVELHPATAVAEMKIYAGENCRLSAGQPPDSSWRLSTGAYRPSS